MPDLDSAFDRLTAMMREHADGLVAARDDAEQLYLETPGEPAKFFGAVMRRKSQVAYHLMPLYWDAGLLDDLNPALRKRCRASRASTSPRSTTLSSPNSPTSQPAAGRLRMQ